MSSMLEQAIVDAEQLKETAKKIAEENVVEKYQDEIKEAIEKILEQEDVDEEAFSEPESMDLVEELPAVQTAEENEIVEIDLNKLEEMMKEELEDDNLEASDKISREEIAEEVLEEEPTTALDTSEEDETVIELDESELLELLSDEDEIELNEENIASMIASMLDEKFIPESDVDSKAKEETDVESTSKLEEVDEAEELEEEAKPDFLDLDKDGDKEEPMKKAAKDANAVKESKLLQKENKSLLKEQKRAERKVHMLQEKVEKYGTVITQLKEKLNESNLTNAKLLYQNRILNSVSLNERQKDKIVEAISNATSVEEAKLIFETLQSAVGVSKRKRKKPESLNEVVTRSSSAFIPRKEVKPSTDAFSERMKRLAGLK